MEKSIEINPVQTSHRKGLGEIKNRVTDPPWVEVWSDRRSGTGTEIE